MEVVLMSGDRIASVRREASGLWAGGTGKLLIVIACGWGLLNGTRMIYPVLLPYLSAEFDLTLTTAGLLVTLIWLGYAIGQVPSGVLADRRGERAVLTAGVAIVAVSLVLVVFAPSAFALFVATGFVGLGLSLYPVARITVLSDMYPDRIGRALGVTMAMGDIGQTVLPPVAAAIAAAVAWQAGLGFIVPPLLAVVLALWVTLPAGTTTPGDESVDDGPNGIGEALATLRHPTLLTMGIILFLYIGTLQTFSAFYPIYLTDQKGLSSTAASVLFGLFFAIGVVAKPLAGTAYDRIGIRRSLPIVLAGAVVGFAILPLVERLVSLVAVTVLISTMLGSGAITQSYLSDTIPAEIQGTGLGLIRSSAAMLGATGPVLFGAVADRGYFNEAYFVLAALVGAITLLTLRLPRE
ncbi:MFS transporter [Halalkalicoccus jeotgali]|uniref:Major facilitator superfamily MFS_1 n=1 Tax=Halalkalicoccus jeotgali (strain DSM 18796 / CECT 7217 / JCM 14584 / KCTC 4019 / B3) TaxID=795797 RepID=D8J7C4_HALJB|nr:MFS transporter [Halalkalicoccus jeotgali]ADJ14019.1 major facilitator superfamily MFS_1 [Halalkalicoccus jeotgali B3]ELY33935.1 major facilitator superfamily protein [Halalkalicoccus jeotgali B3]